MRAKRAKIRRAVHPVQPAPWPYAEGAVVQAEDHMGVDLRKLARGRPCMVRLPGCDGGGETTVLAHLRVLPYCGIGIKPNDFVFGAWACARCHEVIDFREATAFDQDYLRLAHAKGVLRTQMALIELGLVNV